MEQVIMEKLAEIQQTQSDIRVESMAMKMEINETIHKVDTRLVSLEAKFKIVVPAVTFVFVALGGYIKKKLMSLIG